MMSIRKKLIQWLNAIPKEEIIVKADSPKDQRGGAIRSRYILKNWTNDELIEHIIACHMKPTDKHDWFLEYMMLDKEVQRLRNVLSSDYHTKKELNHALHMADLEEKVKKLKQEVRTMQEKAEVFNKQLYATGYIVNCTGCWAGRPANAKELTREKIDEIKHLANRLSKWLDNHEYRMRNNKEYREYVENSNDQ